MLRNMKIPYSRSGKAPKWTKLGLSLAGESGDTGRNWGAVVVRGRALQQVLPQCQKGLSGLQYKVGT